MTEKYADAAEPYQPEHVQTLFVAEAPPADPTRYFYFPEVIRGDSLWVELMKACYPGLFGETKSERARKDQWLRQFADDGFFLIDAIKSPIPKGCSSAEHVRLISAEADLRATEIAALAPVAIVLIKVTVFKGLSHSLKSFGLPLLHDHPIPFPGSGQQPRFHAAMRKMKLPRLGG